MLHMAGSIITLLYGCVRVRWCVSGSDPVMTQTAPQSHPATICGDSWWYVPKVVVVAASARWPMHERATSRHMIQNRSFAGNDLYCLNEIYVVRSNYMKFKMQSITLAALWLSTPWHHNKGRINARHKHGLCCFENNTDWAALCGTITPLFYSINFQSQYYAK